MSSLLSSLYMEGFSSPALLKIVQVISKTLAFHTSVNYQLKAPEPFTAEVHEDLFGDLARIEKQSYPSDYDLHIDFSRTLKRLNDGHCVWINSCYVRISKRKILIICMLTQDGSTGLSVALFSYRYIWSC
jgi:hypothetical protein